MPSLNRPTKGTEYVRRPDVNAESVRVLCPDVSRDVAERVEISVKYEGYLDRQAAEAQRLQGLEEHRFPLDFDFDAIPGLRAEARMRLSEQRPVTVGQASRIFGVTRPMLGCFLSVCADAPEPEALMSSGGASLAVIGGINMDLVASVASLSRLQVRRFWAGICARCRAAKAPTRPWRADAGRCDDHGHRSCRSGCLW